MTRHQSALAVHPDRQQGFTLIEIIITLVVLSILAIMVVQFMGSSFTNSVLPSGRLQTAMNLQTVMENMRTDFAHSPDLARLKGAVGTGEQDNVYGTYTVIDNRFIKFVSNAEQAGVVGDGMLKVTIQDPSTGQSMSNIFVAWW